MGYGTGGSLWDDILDAATAATGLVAALRGPAPATTPPATTRAVAPSAAGVPWYVWAGGGLLALLVVGFALRK